MSGHGYKKYMKKNSSKDYTLLKLFVVSFFGMLLVFTFLIKSLPSPDVSIGDYKQDVETDNTEDVKKIVDDRLTMIQDEDRGKSFSEMMKKADDIPQGSTASEEAAQEQAKIDSVSDALTSPAEDPVYKVFIGTYTSAEQAKVARDIILETGISLTPIVKCIGSNNYTLQVGIFKNKAGADALLNTVQQNHLPGRIVQEY